MPQTVVFGMGQFSEVLAHHVRPDYRTVHRAYLPHQTGAMAFEDLECCDLYLAVGPKGLNANRESIYNEARQKHRVMTWVHPKANVDGSIGDGCIVFEFNNIQPHSILGHNVTLWSGNHVGHHSRIGAHSFISSHCVISGGVVIGERCFLGVNCSTRDHIKIGNRCIVTPNSYVDRDIPDDSVWRGNELLSIPSSKVKL